MKNRSVSIIVVLIIAAIITVIILDYSSKRPDRLGDNPYEYNVDEYKAVDEGLIGYKEIKNIPIRDYVPGGIAIHEDILWLTGDGTLQAITTSGVQTVRKPIWGKGECITATATAVFVGFEDHVEKFDHTGNSLGEWDVPGSNCVFTSMSAGDSILFVADAGNRRVLRYDFNGNLLGEFEGKAESNAGHGFIVPTANFGLVVNDFSELWIVNPGRHAIENYTFDGELRGFWQLSAMTIEGFSGCCNPAEITTMEDGTFVTSEKSMVRIKTYTQGGELISVVAPPAKFREEGKAPEVVVDSSGMIYALDFDRRMIRVFKKNES